MESTWNEDFLSLNLNLEQRQFSDDFPKRLEDNFMDLERKIIVNKEADIGKAEFERISKENKELRRLLGLMCENYNTLQSQLTDLMKWSTENSRKRKEESNNNNNNNNNNLQSSSSENSCKKQREDPDKMKISRVYVRTDASDTSLVVKDVYQWRKYGQKMTRDNPCPRAYYKCSFAPVCPVKKKVQRSPDDRTILVATYEGEHTHALPSSPDAPSCTTGSTSSATIDNSLPSSSLVNSSCPTTTLDLTTHNLLSRDVGKIARELMKLPEFQNKGVHQFLLEQMASSLTSDPSFTRALAAAVSDKILRKPSNNNS